MSQPMHPNPAQLPTLTEVIELLPPAPVGEAGMASSPRPAPPPVGSPAAAPIVTGGLAASQTPPSWTPMTTVVLPTLSDVAAPPMGSSALDLPVLEAVVLPVVPTVVPSVVAPVLAPVVPPVVPVQADVADAAGDAAQPVAAAVSLPPAAPPVLLPEVSEAQLSQRVLGVVQRQIDGMIDFRLKEAMAPILARHTEALVRELREELSQTMADVVARAVAQEMAKLRHR